MFECKYKFELEDAVISAKYVYKSQRRKQDKIIAILIPILMVCMVAMLIYDIVAGKSFVWDVILLIALLVLELMYLIMPLILTSSQKKSFKKNNLDEMDYLLITFDSNICNETMFKNDVEVAKNTHNLKNITSYLEDNERIILVFNKVEFVCIRKNALNKSVEQFKEFLNKTISKNASKKK